MVKIKTGIASYGLSGSAFHAPFIDVHPGFELTAIVERSKNLARERYPEAVIIRSFEELISVNEIELVVVNTPDPTHYQYCRAALMAGKHVVVEKPFVFSVARAEELVALASERGLLLTVYQNRRFDGDFMTLASVVRSGELGRIVEFNASFQRYRNHIEEGSWKERADRRVGMTYNLGSHSLDQALVLFGMPEKVWADIAVLRDGGAVDDYFNIVLFYPRMRVNLKAGYLMREAGPRFAVHGTAGSFVTYGLDPQEEALRGGARPGSEGWGLVAENEWGVVNSAAGRRKYPMTAGNYALFYDNIHACLRNGAEPQVTHHQMLNLVRLLEAAFESAASGHAVKVGWETV